jgi:hypothetical protein
MRRRCSNSAIGVLFVILWSGHAFKHVSQAAEPQQSSPANSDASGEGNASSRRSEPGQKQEAQKNGLPPSLQSLFQRLDKLGRADVKDAKFVTLKSVDPREPQRQSSENAWLVTREEGSIKVLKDDLIPWVYDTKAATVVPSSWGPRSARVESVTEADFEDFCRNLIKPNSQGKAGAIAVQFPPPGASYRVLIAHAAWKKGLLNYCEPLLANSPTYKSNFDAFQSAVFEDLAWLHFLRGVNLLMYADRKEVIPHLRLAIELSPNGQFAAPSKDLIDHLEKLIEDDGKPKQPIIESNLKGSELAEFYVSQLKGIHCPQMSQPGFIMPYLAVVDGKAGERPPTVKLKEMGMTAVPALIKALDDDTPTRTVYHWRDFHHSRTVWRVSDFAWTILRDITGKDFGDRNTVGFTLSSMTADDKRRVIESIKRWYDANKGLSEDDRMFGFFSTRDPKDWITAGNYFLKQKNTKAVKPLLDKIAVASDFRKGDLCELVAGFGDPSVKDTLRQVMTTAHEPSDRMSAAAALWSLGDDSGIPVALHYVTAKDQTYGSWDDPFWLLVRAKSKEGMEAIQKVVMEVPPPQAAEAMYAISGAITGDLNSKQREPVGCVEICPALVAAMGRAEETGGSSNGVKTRVKDLAANAFAVLRDGSGKYPGRFARANPESFNEADPSEAKRDAQIRALVEWYEKHRSKLFWDLTNRRLEVRE